MRIYFDTTILGDDTLSDYDLRILDQILSDDDLSILDDVLDTEINIQPMPDWY
jgi:hypothetical protein